MQSAFERKPALRQRNTGLTHLLDACCQQFPVSVFLPDNLVSLKHLHGCSRRGLLCRIERELHFDCTVRERRDGMNDNIIVPRVCKAAGEMVISIGILVVGSPLLVGSLVIRLI